MELLLNILHYFLYKLHHKVTFNFYKYTGIFMLFNVPFIKKRFNNKFNIQDPKEFLLNWWKNPHYGGSSWYSYIIFNIAFMPPGLLLIYIYEIIFGIPETALPYIFILLFQAAIITLVSYIYLLRNNKYVAYIRLFDKKTKKWKIGWSFISACFLLLPTIVTVLGLKYLP